METPQPQQYEIYDTLTKRRVGKLYTNRRRAQTRADTLDNEYGAYRYYVHPVKPEEQ